MRIITNDPYPRSDKMIRVGVEDDAVIYARVSEPLHYYQIHVSALSAHSLARLCGLLLISEYLLDSAPLMVQGLTKD